MLPLVTHDLLSTLLIQATHSKIFLALFGSDVVLLVEEVIKCVNELFSLLKLLVVFQDLKLIALEATDMDLPLSCNSQL